MIINILELAKNKSCKSIAIPCMAKVFGIPKEDSVYFMISICSKWAANNQDSSLKFIKLCSIKEKTNQIYKNFLGAIFKTGLGRKKTLRMSLNN